jgi:hypothetical protein
MLQSQQPVLGISKGLRAEKAGKRRQRHIVEELTKLSSSTVVTPW